MATSCEPDVGPFWSIKLARIKLLSHVVLDRTKKSVPVKEPALVTV